MATIQPRETRSGTRWRVVYRDENRRQKAVTFVTEDAARRWRDLLGLVGPDKATAMLAEQDAAAEMTVTELITWHIGRRTGITRGTRTDYERITRQHITPHLGVIPISALDRTAISGWVNTLDAQGMAGKTVRNVHSLLSSALSDAVSEELLTRNVAKGIRLPATERDEMVFLSRDEYETLLGLIPAHYRPFVRILAETGMRFGEATALQAGDLDFANGQIRILRAWKRGVGGRTALGPTKGRSARTIAMPWRSRAELAELVRGRAGTEWVFTNTRGGVIQSSPFHSSAWGPAVHAFAGDTRGPRDPKSRRDTWQETGSGKRPRVHDLRHSFASWAIAAGLPLTAIQRHMGHQSIKTTSDTYGHIAQADRDAFADLTGDVMARRMALAGRGAAPALTPSNASAEPPGRATDASGSGSSVHASQ